MKTVAASHPVSPTSEPRGSAADAPTSAISGEFFTGLKKSAVVRLLIVEDDQVDRLKLHRLLGQSRRGHYQIEECTTAQEALDRCRQNLPDCILLDFVLPGMDGVQFIRELMARPDAERAPVVLLTGNTDNRVAVSAMKAGATDYVNKDELSVELLESVVRYAIEKRTSDALRHRLDRSARMALIGQLAAGVAHEINNPAAYILANLEESLRLLTALWREQPNSKTTGDEAQPEPEAVLAEVTEMLTDCVDGTKRVAAIVSELRQFSNLNPEQIEDVQLDEVVRAASRLVQTRLEKDCRLECVLNSPPVIAADRNKLIQVVTNLMMNAAHAVRQTERAAVIRIETGVLDDRLLLSVDDSGPGIPAELRARVFEPFYTTKSYFEGTGVGLSLSAEYVHRHGGAIEVETSELGGARFLVTLPCHTGLGRSASRSASASPARRPGLCARVLLIDDEPSILRIFETILSQQHRVKTASSAQEAFALLERDREFDMVICDVHMEGMDGLEFREELRRRHPELVSRLVFCTGGTTLNEKDGLFLKKPLLPRDLLEAVRAFVGEP